jgi:hypothetical protein
MPIFNCRCHKGRKVKAIRPPGASAPASGSPGARARWRAPARSSSH